MKPNSQSSLPRSGMSTPSATHILIIPHPAQGHLLPLLDLTHHLSLRGLHATILITPQNLPILSPLLSSHPSIQTLVLPLPPHPNLPPGLENLNQIGPSGNLPIVSSLSSLSPSISDWFISHPHPPHAILSDFFLGWTLDLARSLNIPRFAFFSSGFFASSFLALLFSDLTRFKNAAAAAADSVVELADLPGSPVFPEPHLPSIFRSYDDSDPDSRLFKNGYLSNLSSHGCVFNSFRDLESPFLDHFKRIAGRVYAVGPISLLAGSAKGGANSEVLTWLDDSPDGSVLYVSFGSQKWLTEPQLQALGRALEKSGTRFIWVVRTGPESNLAFLEERVAGRGLVIKGWAPQVEILGHRAVGGFLSHCGWNSVLESVVAGVMILAWPMEADQFLNARFLVEEDGVAVRVCEGADTVPDPDEMGRVIREAMGLDVLEKRKAEEMRVKAVAAVDEGGSSSVDLDDFVNELLRIGSG